MKYLQNYYELDIFHWYEHHVFDLLDTNPEKEWSHKKEKRRKIKVIFYGIIKGYTDNKQYGFCEDFDFKESNFLGDAQWNIHPEDDSDPFAVRAMYLVDN